MSRISDAELFVAVVDARGFSAAARRLDRSQPVVSRQLAALEHRLGVRLLERTTRRVQPTPAGALFYERCRDAVAALVEAERLATDAATSPRGRLRVSAPPAYARRHLTPLLPEFAAAFPDVTLELILTDRYVDLVEERFELAIRLGPLRSSSLASRVLSIERYVLCAAPAYLRRHRAPRSLDELAAHNCLVLGPAGSRHRWTFVERGTRRTVEVSGNLATNDAGLLHAAARAGLGITALPTYSIEDDLAAADLVELLPQARLPTVDVHALLPSRRHVPRRVRVFLDLLARGLRRPGRTPTTRHAVAPRRDPSPLPCDGRARHGKVAPP